MKTPKIGRPPVAKNKAKGSLLSVRLTESERAALDAAAECSGIKLSEWARRALLAATLAK